MGQSYEVFLEYEWFFAKCYRIVTWPQRKQHENSTKSASKGHARVHEKGCTFSGTPSCACVVAFFVFVVLMLRRAFILQCFFSGNHFI